MPELPEVETIRLTLAPKLIGRTIQAGTVSHAKLVQNMPETQLLTELRGKEITDLKRRGKYLLIKFTDGWTLTIHLRMTGQLIVVPVTEPVADATYFRLSFDNQTELRFRDQRKFGRVALFPQGQLSSGIENLGPEPLDPQFTIAVLTKQLSGRKLAIKKALLDQTVIAGIGNIYADEALFVSGIHPARLVESFTDPELAALFAAIQQVLREGIEYRGTTKRDYRTGDGATGEYQNQLRVYGRKGLPCPKCGAPVLKMIFAGRGTHFCPLCQS